MNQAITVGSIVKSRGRLGQVLDILDGRNYRNGKPRASIQWLGVHYGAYIQLDALKLDALSDSEQREYLDNLAHNDQEMA